MKETELKQYFVEFERIQDIQISLFEGKNQFHSNNNTNIANEIDLETMLFERSRAFENLRNAISIVPESVINNFKQDADTIIRKDRLLMTRLEEHKKELLKKINQSQKGKQLLKGYRIGTTNSLRFMNNKI